jgi:Protein of unknown function (DUF1282).
LQYKNIFKLVFSLISSPAKAWEDISVNQDSQKVIVDYVYPMIGFCGIAWLIGSIYRRGWNTPLSFQLSMVDCCGIAIALFGGFFLAAYIVNKYLLRQFRIERSPQQVLVFIGYSMTMVFIADMITGILPSMQPIGIMIQLYTLYIVYVGSTPMMKVEASFKMPFTIAFSIIIIGCPMLIEFIYQNLVTIFN